ncbi:MAG TPA: BamA/TamA family outer membrane protein [Thermoanaerobaculia bacterium]|nr:BamA/TamA family outer membrane protein [Thermoanaerobaculia bacterium]
MKRIATLLALFVFFLAVPSAFPFGQNKIVYDNFKWKVYHSTHFDFYFYEEERGALQKVVDSAETAYSTLSTKFNYQISKKIPLIFYHTHSAFEQTNVDLNFIPEGVGAFAEPARNRMVLPIDMSDDKLLQIITHELTHIFEYEVLFQGKLGKTITANPPTWLMEGLASFMAQDEESRDRMVLRDAVVADRVPRITQNPRGYFAYRFGHGVFKFIVDKYGWEGLREFIYEYRNTLGSSVDKAIKRAFDLTPEEFDTRFRTWLRKQYLPALIDKGEPEEYGDRFKVGENVDSFEISPVPSPSGDLLAAFATYKEDVDAVIFNIPERKLLKNLTSGYTSIYEYPVVQSFTVGPDMGRDIAFAPNGDQVAFFVKKERGRNLLIVNPLTGGIIRSVPMDQHQVEQQLSPTYSPDGRKIAFSAFHGNQADIYLYDIENGEIKNLTGDSFFDGAPVFSPDGQWLVYSSVVSGTSETSEAPPAYAKLFKLNVANPAERYQLTNGPWNDIDAYFSPDGKRIFYASDKQTGRNIVVASNILEKAEDAAKREGDTPKADPTNFAAYNIYSLDLASGDVLQYTDVVGGCFTPVVFTGSSNKERMVFSSYYKGEWRLYSTDTNKPLHEAEKTTLPSAPVTADTRQVFKTTSEFFIDEEKIEQPGGFKLFVDDVEVNAGVSSDQLFVSRSIIYMSDMLGNRRFIASLDSVSSFSNFDFLYFDLHKRMNWGFRVFDNRSFFTTFDTATGRFNQRQDYRETGALGLISYPFTRYHRFDAGAGYISRDVIYPFPVTSPEGERLFFFIPRRDNYPVVSTTFTGDSTTFKYFGPVDGRRYNISATYAPDTSEGGTLSSDINIDWREYYQLSSRTLFAARVFLGYSSGNAPNFYYFGGLNTLRGYDFRTIIGNKAGFANFEFRFPLVDVLATPILTFQQVRGVLFFDIGAATFDGEDFKFTEDGRLKDGKAAVGWGFSLDFLGLELHWDFAKRFDGKDTEGGFRTSFWIGETF